jgi:AcrR family transcriptional regulator
VSAAQAAVSLPAVGTGRWPARGPRLWEDPHFKLFGGNHGLPPAVVMRIQRDRLLDAMIAVVGQVGYQAASVEKVIAAAGISRRTFYDVFRDRDECFVAAYEDVASCLLVQTAEARRHGHSPRDRIKRVLDAFLGFWTEEPDAARACIVEVLAAGPTARTRRATTVEWLTDLVEPDLHALRGGVADTPLAARAFVGAVHELTYMYIERGQINELPALADQIIDSQLARGAGGT